jgi:hypothetical protein
VRKKIALCTSYVEILSRLLVWKGSELSEVASRIKEMNGKLGLCKAFYAETGRRAVW